MPGDRTIGGEDDAFNNFVSVTGAGVHVPCPVRRSRADGCSVCVHWHVPAIAPEQLILGKEDATNTSARGHHIFGREILDFVFERTRKLADSGIARRGFFFCNPFGRSSGLWSRVLAAGLYGCRLRDEVACAVVW